MARFEIRHFDEPLPVDRVIFAIDPVDTISFRIRWLYWSAM